LELKKLQETRGLILFLDPDYQGERIRRIITDFVGPTKHAFLPKEQAISKNAKKVGIEHATPQNIVKSLNSVKTINASQHSSITTMDMYELGLIGTKDAKINRMKLSKSLGIGFANGKSMLNKLHMFGITKEQVIAHLKD
jgi:ribonuclease M5